MSEIRNIVVAWGEPKHRASQIFQWLNKKGCESFSEMTNLPKTFIRQLDNEFSIGKLKQKKHLISKDRTEKFLWTLKDGETIETVLIVSKNRKTLCVSTQVGCKFRCPFCASGKRGLVRDLSVSEIISQLIYVSKDKGIAINNIVFMGMGEPLDNIENVSKAIEIINDKAGINIGARKITVSTCGLIPGIAKLKKMKIQVELSISLHAVNDKLRNVLVPVNRKYPLEHLLDACKDYKKVTGRMITLEYVLIKGMNSSRADALELAKIAKDLKAKVNLIGYNGFDDSEYKAPEIVVIKRFQDVLLSKNVTVTLRRSRGADIQAACGQLAG